MEPNQDDQFNLLSAESSEGFVEVLTAQFEATKNPFDPADSSKRKAELAVEEIKRNVRTKIVVGLKTLINCFVEFSKQDPQSFNPRGLLELKDGIKEFTNSRLTDVEASFVFSEASEAAFLDLSEKLLSLNRIQEANDILYMLTYANPDDSKQLCLLGVSEFLKENYELAKEIFEMCKISDPDNPGPSLYQAYCCEKMNDPQSAFNLVEEVLNKIIEQPEFESLSQQLQIYLKTLKGE